MPPLVATWFTDFASPAARVTEAALVARAGGGDLELRFRAWELHPPPEPLPAAPAPLDPALAELAAAEGIVLRDPGFTPRTRKAHEAVRFAAERGQEQPMRQAIWRALWEEGRDVGRIDVLRELVAPLGLDPEELRIALDIDRFRDEVAADHALGRRLHLPPAPVLYLGTGGEARVLLGALSRPALDEAIARR